MGKNEEWDGRERREQIELSEEQEDRIAGKAADKIWQTVYTELGKAALRAVLLVGGTFALLGLAWLGASGKIKI